MNELVAVVLAYLLGSIPFAYLAGRARGIDLRKVGSGNLGAANVFRNLGRGWGIAVMAADIGKGILAVVLAKVLTDDPWPAIAAGGHTTAPVGESAKIASSPAPASRPGEASSRGNSAARNVRSASAG